MSEDAPRIRTLKAMLTDDELARFQASIAPVGQADAVWSIVRWFADQPDVVRKESLGMLPAELRADVARLVLERMAGKRKR